METNIPPELRERFEKIYAEVLTKEPSLINGFMEAMHSAYQLDRSEWVSVEDRLPETESVILVYTISEYIQTAYLEASSRLWVGIGNYRQPKVTHWMPLPQKPL